MFLYSRERWNVAGWIQACVSYMSTTAQHACSMLTNRSLTTHNNNNTQPHFNHKATKWQVGWRKDVFWLMLSVLRGTGGLRWLWSRQTFYISNISNLKQIFYPESFSTLASHVAHQPLSLRMRYCQPPRYTSTAVCPWKKPPQLLAVKHGVRVSGAYY